MPTLKLYRVTCRGMQTSGASYGISYVVAEDTAQAYAKVRQHLDERDLGFTTDRELEKVELIAEATNYPNCDTQLHL